MNWRASIIFCTSLGAVIASALLFALNSQFFAAGIGGPFACKTLLSTGSDDEVVMMYYVLLIPSLFYRAVRFRQAMNTVELLLLGCALSLASFGAAMGRDCGEFFYTAFGLGDIYLVVFTIGILVTISASVLLRRRNAPLA